MKSIYKKNKIKDLVEIITVSINKKKVIKEENKVEVYLCDYNYTSKNNKITQDSQFAKFEIDKYHAEKFKMVRVAGFSPAITALAAS